MDNLRLFEKIFETDVITKRERVERALNHQPVDRVPLHEQLSHNPGVIELYTGKKITGFDYTDKDIGIVIRKTMDLCFPPRSPLRTGRMTDEDGFVVQNDNWTSWHVSRPFDDHEGACNWLKKRTQKLLNANLDNEKARREYRDYMLYIQSLVGETVVLNYSWTGMCSAFDGMGLEIFTYFYYDYPEVMVEFMEASTSDHIRYIHAVADKELSPVILIAEDFATKQGPIFGPEFLGKIHCPYVKRVTDAWHSHGIKVIYHSDGNYKKAIPDLINCGVDGFYCLEPNCGMDIVELKNSWPEMVWMGGLDGVELMERGTPEEVRREVHRHILETKALETGGMFVATSSEINPPIKPENFKAMVDAVGELCIMTNEIVSILYDLLCEYARNPLGIDTPAPRFSWKIQQTGRGQIQTAYKIIVAESLENISMNYGDLWDSGWVEDCRSVNVAYGGKPLTSGQTCWWKVKIRDRDGNESPYSDTACFRDGPSATGGLES